MDWYRWLILLHVAGVLGFVLAHGTSVMVAFKLRGERDPIRIGALLDLSSSSLALAYASLLIILGSGIATGFLGGHWDRFWIWAALAVLIVIIVAMYPLGSMHYAKVRHAVGVKAYQDKADAPPPEPASPGELAALLVSPQPWILTAVGGGGLLIILWLMIMEPF